jgi:hypothetical protein
MFSGATKLLLQGSLLTTNSFRKTKELFWETKESGFLGYRR